MSGGAAREGGAALEKEKMLNYLISIYRVKKRPTTPDKELAKKIKSLQHGYDGEIDICVFCKQLMSIKALTIHHPGTDPSSYRLEDIESACFHCNNVENGKKGSTHAAPAAPAASSRPSLRPRENMPKIESSDGSDKAREERLIRESPVTFQKRREWEPAVREYLWRYVGEDDSKPFEKAVKEAAEFSGASQQAAEKYIESACSALGPFRHTDNDVICRRTDWKAGLTAMSELDLKILKKIADEKKQEAAVKESELKEAIESTESMSQQLQTVAGQREILVKQLAQATGKPISQIYQELGLYKDEKKPGIQ